MVYHVTMSNGRPITLLPNVFRRNNANNMTFVKQRRESQSYGIASKACLRYKA
jgi:hypothetical protein